MTILKKARRKLIQIAAFGFNNPCMGNFARGKLYKGPWKQFCSPGLNCYSCPAARLSCPIGAMQAVNGSMNFRFSFYAVGFLLAVGAVFGRAVCGWVCPFGLLQELLYGAGNLIRRLLSAVKGSTGRVPAGKESTVKETECAAGSGRLNVWKPLTYIKYIILLVFVLLLPTAATDALGMGEPAFCQYICPAGTLEAGIPLLLTHPELSRALGELFALKAGILAIVLIGSVLVERFFCKTLCPLGAIYAILNKISLLHLSCDQNKCVSCGQCARVCPMDIDPVKTANAAECIRCGRCSSVCPADALHLGFSDHRES